MMYSRFCSFLLAIGFLSTSLFAVNGVSVSTSWQWTNWNYTGDRSLLPGTKLVRFDITNNEPVSNDTLYHNRCAYPALDINGETVAFYADDERGKHWIATIGIDGANLRKLVEIEDYADAAHLDWHANEYIYYEKPNESSCSSVKGSGEIWKISVHNPSDNSRVWDYRSVDDCQSWVRRFSLSADGKRAGCQLRGDNGGQFIHTVPYGSGSTLGGEGACNLSISTSGKYFATYRWTAHADLFLFHYNDGSGQVEDLRDTYGIPNLHNEVAASLGFDPGNGCEVIRWSANSDKWVLQNVGWHGHADAIRKGSNQVIYNFINKEAIMPSRNPKLDDCGLPCTETTAYFNNTTGDFRIDGPAGKMETLDGAWVDVAGTVALNDRHAAGPRWRGENLIVDRAGLTLTFGASAHRTIGIYDMRGARVLSLSTSRSTFHVPERKLNPGTYVVRITGEQRVISKAVTVGGN